MKNESSCGEDHETRRCHQWKQISIFQLKKEEAVEVTPLSWGNLSGFSIRYTIFHYLASWTGFFGPEVLKKECWGWWWAVLIFDTKNFFPKKSNSMMLVKKITQLVCEKKWSVSWNKVACLKESSEVHDFYLKTGSGFEGLGGTSHRYRPKLPFTARGAT